MSEDNSVEIISTSKSGGIVNTENKQSPEVLNTSNRVLVFGSRVSEAFKLAEDFEKYLEEKGIPTPSVEVCRDIQYISDAFYKKPPENLVNNVSKKTATLNSSKSLSELIKRGLDLIDHKPREEVLQPDTSSNDIPHILPFGVIVLPEMRLYTPDGVGMTVDSPYEQIEELCKKNGVPIIKIGDTESKEITPEQLSQGVVEILTSRDS
jgi:hypothetical protein